MPAAANAAVATRSARAMANHGTPVRSYVKTVTRPYTCGLRDSARPAIANPATITAAIQTLFIFFTSAR